MRVVAPPYELDVNSNLLAVADGDLVNIEVSPASAPPDMNYVMQGVVYKVNAGATYISCGGLLARVPDDASDGDRLAVGIEVIDAPTGDRIEVIAE